MVFASYLLRDRARDWWEVVSRAVVSTTMVIMTWDDFVSRFQRDFALVIEVHQLVRELRDLFQTTETMVEIILEFKERALLAPHYTVDEEMRMKIYYDMLREDIREFMRYSRCKTMNDMIEMAYKREIELVLKTKRKLEQV